MIFKTMIWQDVVLAIGQWIFVIALLPSVFGENKPAFFTSVLTATMLGVFAFAFATMSLLATAFPTAVLALTWAVLAVQGFRKKLTDK